MRQMPSAQFRTQYAKLAEPTQVTVLGRVIGLWLPNGYNGELMRPAPAEPEFVSGPVIVTNAPRVLDGTAEGELRRSRQATIDATLAKVNRKKDKP